MSDSGEDLRKTQDTHDLQADPFLRRLKSLVLIMCLVMIAGMAFVATSITKMISSHQQSASVSWQKVPEKLTVNYADFGLDGQAVRPLDVRGEGRYLHVWRGAKNSPNGAFLVLDLQTKTIVKTIQVKADH